MLGALATVPVPGISDISGRLGPQPIGGPHQLASSRPNMGNWQPRGRFELVDMWPPPEGHIAYTVGPFDVTQ